MRLAGGKSPNEGRLEIRLEDSTVWHSVCAQTFNLVHVPSLLCAELGWPYSPTCSTIIIAPTTDLPADYLGQSLTMSGVCFIGGGLTTLSEACPVMYFRDAPSSRCNRDAGLWIQCLAGR